MALIATNTRFVGELAAANATLGVAVTDIAALRVQMNNLGDNRNGRGRGRGRGAGGAGRGRGGRGAVRTVRLYNNNNYCYTHGHDIAENHTSASYSWPCQGHRTDATKEDDKGGSNRFRELVQ